MAEPIIVNLQDRGQQIIRYIDLFTEDVLGAGQLTAKGRYYSLGDLKTGIEDVLKNSPIEKDGEATTPLSVNRFNSNNNWGKREQREGDLYPNKSRYLVHFVLDFDFGNDFCFIDLGINWAPFQLASGELNPDYPLGERNFGDKVAVSDLKILKTTMITLDDAEIILKELGLSDPRNEEIVDVTQEITDKQLEELEVEEDGRVLTASINGNEYVLTHQNKVLTTTAK